MRHGRLGRWDPAGTKRRSYLVSSAGSTSTTTFAGTRQRALAKIGQNRSNIECANAFKEALVRMTRTQMLVLLHEKASQ